jgi:HlyD family secretion protein
VHLQRSAIYVVTGAAVVAAVAYLALRATPVTVRPAERRDMTPVVRGVGTVEAKTVVLLGSRIAGRLVSVTVDQGDPVEEGQILVRLDDAQLAVDVRRAEAALRAADAQLRDLLAGARREELGEARANLERANAQLDDLVAGARRPEVSELEERLASAAATAELAERDHRRIQQLFDKELVSAQDAERARQAYAVAAAQQRAARHVVQQALDGARSHQVDAARSQVVALQYRLDLLAAGPRVDQVTTQRAQVQEAAAALALARERLTDATIRSPLTGAVVSRELEAGATVNPGTPILKLIDPRSAWITIHVDERDTGAIAVGDPARVALRSLGAATVAGRVARIRRESDRVTEQLAVDVALDAPASRLTLGEQADAVITPRARTGVLAVPQAAIVRRPDTTGVLVVVDGRIRFRPARLGARDGEGFVETVAGVRPGDVVVLRPGALAEPAREGQRVAVRSGAP